MAVASALCWLCTAIQVLSAAAPLVTSCITRFSLGMLADLLWTHASVGVKDEELLNAAALVSTYNGCNTFLSTYTQGVKATPDV